MQHSCRSNTDISLLKSIPIFERARPNIQAEMINACNHPNWSITDNFSGSTNNPAHFVNVQSTTYSAASIANANNGAGGARSIQFRVQLAIINREANGCARGVCRYL